MTRAQKRKLSSVKLSTIGFYYDFTRLFAKLHGQVTPSKQRVEVTNYATHASGYFFENADGMKRVFLPMAARLAPVGDVVSEEALGWVSRYLVISGLSRKKAQRISKKYLTYFTNEFQVNRPDVVIISGDTRMQSRAAALACSNLGIRHYYFEQGPFGTTILDPEGVNCTASFAKKFEISDPVTASSEVGTLTNAPKLREKVAERTVVRTLDYLVQPLFLGLGFFEIKEEKKFLKQVRQKTWKLTKFRSVTNDFQTIRDPFILIVGQVPTDANFSLNSPYSKPLELVRDVQQVFLGEAILFREHPLFIGSYGEEFYNYFEKHANLKLSRGSCLNTEIEGAKHIVIVNSTVGMEVVLKHQKPILCLGDASYNHLRGVFGRNDLAGFHRYPPNVPEEAHRCNWKWFQKSFVSGHFRDKDLSQLVSNILERIDAA